MRQCQVKRKSGVLTSAVLSYLKSKCAADPSKVYVFSEVSEDSLIGLLKAQFRKANDWRAELKIPVQVVVTQRGNISFFDALPSDQQLASIIDRKSSECPICYISYKDIAEIPNHIVAKCCLNTYCRNCHRKTGEACPFCRSQ